MADPIQTIVTAGAAGLAAFVGAILKPWYEDRLEQRREAREATRRAQAARRARLAEMEAALTDATDSTASGLRALRSLTSLAQSIGDAALIDAIGRMVSAATHQIRNDARGDAQHRLGDLIREHDETV